MNEKAKESLATLKNLISLVFSTEFEGVDLITFIVSRQYEINRVHTVKSSSWSGTCMQR